MFALAIGYSLGFAVSYYGYSYFWIVLLCVTYFSVLFGAKCGFASLFSRSAQVNFNFKQDSSGIAYKYKCDCANSQIGSLNLFLKSVANHQIRFHWNRIGFLIERELKTLLTTFDIGTKPIILNSFGWKFEMIDHTKQIFKIVLDFDILFESNCDIIFTFILIPVGVKDLNLQGAFHLELVGSFFFKSADSLSCFDSMQLYFHDSPKMKYEFSRCASFAYCLSNWGILSIEDTHQLIKNFIDNNLVYPNINIDLK